MPGEPPPPATEKPGWPRSTVLQRVGHDQGNPAHTDIRFFFACGSSVPVRIGREGGAAVWLAGTLAVPSVQGHRRPLPQELWPYRSLFSRGYGDGFTLCVTQQYRLSSMAAWPSSTGISHHNLLLHIPSICLSTVNSSPCPGIAPHSLNSSSQLLCLPGDLCPCPGYVWLRQGLSDSHSI